MRVTRYPDAASFLAAAEPFLLDAEAENSLILGIARSAAGGTGSPGAMFGRPDPADPAYFATAGDDSGIAVAAFRTLPDKLGLTRARDDRALAPLAEAVRIACPKVTEVLAPDPTAERFAAALAASRGVESRLAMRQRIFALRAVTPGLELPPGRLRAAEEGDAVLVPWAAGFYQAIGDVADPAAAVRERRVNGQLFVWDHDGPKAMACWTGKTPNGVRVGFVYTPPELRGHGYATAVVTALTQWLLDRGNEHCVLYTDQANPTSNAIYQRIGYRPIADAALYHVPI